MKIIDGKAISNEILEELSQKIAKAQKTIGLAFLLVGANPASHTYVKMKQKACERVGIRSFVKKLPQETSQEDLLTQIQAWNEDRSIHGILVQLPVPPHIHPLPIMRAIDPDKDVDGFHPVNVGKLLLGEEGIAPCTPRGIQILLARSNIAVEGKHVVILGRSNIVGKPLAAILIQKRKGCNATVTLAHSQTEHLAEITRSADILVAAIGQPHFVKKEMVKANSVIIDVGINRFGDKLIGDVDFEAVLPIVSRITPVPGGVGPMTIAMLMQNTWEISLR